MGVSDGLRVLRRSWRLIAATMVAAIAAAWVVTALTTPQYATTMTFFATTTSVSRGAGDALQGGIFSRDRIKVYADLVRSERLATMVAADQGIGLSSRQVQRRISAATVDDTVLLQVSVTDSVASRSERIARGVATEFANLVRALETPAGAETPTMRVEVVSGPTLGRTPVSPQPVRNLSLGLLVGLALGLTLALARAALDRTVRTAQALQEVTSAPVLTVVPHRTRRARRAATAESYSPSAESFRHLRTNLHLLDGQTPCRVLTVTSAVPGEGRSLVALHLALACAEAGRRVLLVEADLRTPALAEQLDVHPEPGLTDLLTGKPTSVQAIRRWGESTIWLLPSGAAAPNPSELLSSGLMAALLRRERAHFDVIIVDTPPLMPVTDAAVMASLADGTVLVTRAGRTDQDQVRAALTTLQSAGARLLGCVFNDVRPGSGASPYYYAGYRPRPRSESPVAPPATVDPDPRTRHAEQPWPAPQERAWATVGPAPHSAEDARAGGDPLRASH